MVTAEAGAQSQKQEEKTTRKKKGCKEGAVRGNFYIGKPLIRTGKQRDVNVKF